MTIPCSRNTIAICVEMLRYLARYDGSLEQMAEEANTTVATARRALNGLREVLPITHIRYSESGDRVDQWHLERELEPGEPEVIAASVFMSPDHARELLRRARVADVEPYCP